MKQEVKTSIIMHILMAFNRAVEEDDMPTALLLAQALGKAWKKSHGAALTQQHAYCVFGQHLTWDKISPYAMMAM